MPSESNAHLRTLGCRCRHKGNVLKRKNQSTRAECEKCGRKGDAVSIAAACSLALTLFLSRSVMFAEHFFSPTFEVVGNVGRVL